MITKTIVTRSGTQIVNLTAEEEETRRQEQEAWLAANPSKTELEIAMSNLRIKRNELLAESDYIVTMNLEAGTEIPANWSTYRQNLRDLTEELTTVEQVNTVVFPAKP